MRSHCNVIRNILRTIFNDAEINASLRLSYSQTSCYFGDICSESIVSMAASIQKIWQLRFHPMKNESKFYARA